MSIGKFAKKAKYINLFLGSFTLFVSSMSLTVCECSFIKDSPPISMSLSLVSTMLAIILFKHLSDPLLESPERRHHGHPVTIEALGSCLLLVASFIGFSISVTNLYLADYYTDSNLNPEYKIVSYLSVFLETTSFFALFLMIFNMVISVFYCLCIDDSVDRHVPPPIQSQIIRVREAIKPTVELMFEDIPENIEECCICKEVTSNVLNKKCKHQICIRCCKEIYKNQDRELIVCPLCRENWVVHSEFFQFDYAHDSASMNSSNQSSGVDSIPHDEDIIEEV